MNGIADIVGAKTMMSPNTTGSTAARWNPDIEMITIPSRENLGSSMHNPAWIALSQNPSEEET